MKKKISVSLAAAIAIIAMTVTFSVTMILAMKMFDSTVSDVNEKQAMYNKLAEVDKYRILKRKQFQKTASFLVYIFIY